VVAAAAIEQVENVRQVDRKKLRRFFEQFMARRFRAQRALQFRLPTLARAWRLFIEKRGRSFARLVSHQTHPMGRISVMPAAIEKVVAITPFFSQFPPKKHFFFPLPPNLNI
jgi:hypothetical protein